MIGNIIYVIYPAGVGWYQIAPGSYRVIQTLLFHGLMTLYGVLTLAYDDKKLEWKSCWKELVLIILMTVWALLGNAVYNTDTRTYNWFFVVQDPFYILPKNIASIVMPFVMICTIFLGNILQQFSQRRYIDENRARTSFHLCIASEGAPAYEQKGAAKQRRAPEGRFCEWARAERH